LPFKALIAFKELFILYQILALFARILNVNFSFLNYNVNNAIFRR